MSSKSTSSLRAAMQQQVDHEGHGLWCLMQVVWVASAESISAWTRFSGGGVNSKCLPLTTTLMPSSTESGISLVGGTDHARLFPNPYNRGRKQHIAPLQVAQFSKTWDGVSLHLNRWHHTSPTRQASRSLHDMIRG